MNTINSIASLIFTFMLIILIEVTSNVFISFLQNEVSKEQINNTIEKTKTNLLVENNQKEKPLSKNPEIGKSLGYSLALHCSNSDDPQCFQKMISMVLAIKKFH